MASEGSGAKALAEGVPSTLEVSAALMALALAVVLGAMRPRFGRASMRAAVAAGE